MEQPKKQIYFNTPQRLTQLIGANTTVIVAGRRTGKTDSIASPFVLRNMQRMPGSTGGIVVQPFTATDDPSVLGIKPMPRLQERIQELLHKYQAENIDIEDIQYEEADLEENSLFPPTTQENDNGGAEEKNIL